MRQSFHRCRSFFTYEQPHHRANILNPSYSEIGIGIINGGPYGKMITQLFGAQLEHNVIPRDTAIQMNYMKSQT